MHIVLTVHVCAAMTTTQTNPQTASSPPTFRGARRSRRHYDNPSAPSRLSLPVSALGGRSRSARPSCSLVKMQRWSSRWQGWRGVG